MDNCNSIFTQRHFIRMRVGEGESLWTINSFYTGKKKKINVKMWGWKFSLTGIMEPCRLVGWLSVMQTVTGNFEDTIKMRVLLYATRSNTCPLFFVSLQRQNGMWSGSKPLLSVVSNPRTALPSLVVPPGPQSGMPAHTKTNSLGFLQIGPYTFGLDLIRGAIRLSLKSTAKLKKLLLKSMVHLGYNLMSVHVPQAINQPKINNNLSDGKLQACHKTQT